MPLCLATTVRVEYCSAYLRTIGCMKRHHRWSSDKLNTHVIYMLGKFVFLIPHVSI